MKTAIVTTAALGAAYLMKSAGTGDGGKKFTDYLGGTDEAGLRDELPAGHSAEPGESGHGFFDGAGNFIDGAVDAAWDFLTPGGLDGVEAAADYVGDKAKKKAESIAWKLVIIGGVALAGFVVYRKVMLP